MGSESRAFTLHYIPSLFLFLALKRGLTESLSYPEWNILSSESLISSGIQTRLINHAGGACTSQALSPSAPGVRGASLPLQE